MGGEWKAICEGSRTKYSMATCTFYLLGWPFALGLGWDFILEANQPSEVHYKLSWSFWALIGALAASLLATGCAVLAPKDASGEDVVTPRSSKHLMELPEIRDDPEVIRTENPISEPKDDPSLKNGRSAYLPPM